MNTGASFVETVRLRRSGSTVSVLWTKIQRENWSNSKDIILMVEKKDRTSYLADYVKHIFSKRNQEADRSLGEPGCRQTEKIIVKKGNSTVR